MTLAETGPNPLAAGLERLPVTPTNLVIFGATGDLAKRKLLPAIYNLAHEGALPGQFNLIGVSRGELSNDAYREMAAESIRAFSRTPPDESVLSGLLDELRYVAGAFDDNATYDALAAALTELDEADGEPMSRAFYLSTAPEFFSVIVGALGAAGLARSEHADVRVIIEKPFGSSLAEARELNAEVLSVFDESQVFRIDHYLGKETVQNMLAFRFANHAGALRDLVENHMMQLLTLLCMEPPVTFAANDVRDEKVKVLHAIRTPRPDELEQISVSAQYGPGVSGGEQVAGYLQEAGVPADSHTETYAALRLEVDNWRWAGVPFYLRTGKRLARKVTEIAVTLRPVPHLAFEQDGSLGVRPNQLVMTIQPNEGVSLSLGAKIPGTRMRIRPVNMEFLYGTAFLSQSPEAYERLILDAMRGEATLFTRNDEVEAQWRICDPVVSAWSANAVALPQYAAGTQGPAEADRLLLDGHQWRAI